MNLTSDAPDHQSRCFWYGGHEPHCGYENRAGIAKGGKKLSDIDEVSDFWPDNEIVRTDMLDYPYKVEHFDTHLDDLAKNPLCLHNVATDSKHATTKKKLSEQMTRELETQDDPRMFGRGDVFDKYPYADASGRNFYERYMRGETTRAGWVNPTDFENEPIE